MSYPEQPAGVCVTEILDPPISWPGLPVLTPACQEANLCLRPVPTPPAPVLLQMAAPRRLGQGVGVGRRRLCVGGAGQDEQEAERSLEQLWCHRQVQVGNQ